MSLSDAPAQFDSEALKAVFLGAFSRLDRLPGLQAVLERGAALCCEELRDAAVPPPQLVLQQIESGPAAEMLAQHEGHSVAALVNATDWNAHLLMSADRACVFAIVELLLGGDGAQAPYGADRGFSRIEIGVARTFLARVASALERAFAPVAKSAFVMEEADDRINFDAIGRREGPVVVARLNLSVWQQAGEILIVIPKAAVDPLRQVLGRPLPEEDRSADPRWSGRIHDEITRTSVTLSGVLDERLAALEEIASLEVGQILRLNATPETRVRVECNGEPLLWCQLGKSNGVYTLRVDEPVDRDQEFMNDILSG